MEAGVQKILKELEVSKTPLVGLVNNAGIAQTFPVEFHKLTDVRYMYDVSQSVSGLRNASGHDAWLAS